MITKTSVFWKVGSSVEENMAGNARTGQRLNFKHISQEVLSEKGLET